VLAAATRCEREIFDVQEAAQKRTGDVDLRQVGRDARMPWQTDGRRWHTQDRVSHTGKACRWEGGALELVIDVLEACDDFAPVNWNDRSVVEVAGKEGRGGWFLHALTGDEWLLTLKFRVGRNAFREDQLQRELDLKPLDDLDELPVYGRGERVRVKRIPSGQEVTITVHWRREIDTPAFREFLQQAMESYSSFARPAKLNLEDLTPWKVLGRKWHLSRKGFPSGKRVAWEPELLERLASLLETSRTGVRVDWTNQQIVHFHTNGDDASPWATLHTKRRGGIDLTLNQPAGRFALGRFASFGDEREIVPGTNGSEQIRIRFTKLSQATVPEFAEFLREHAGR
jgi:excinuclease ABC subunit A